MHSTIFISTTLSLLAISVTAAPTSSSSSAPISSITPAHLPGIPHAPNLHPSSQTSQSSQTAKRNAARLQKRNLGMEQSKELMVEVKRNGGGKQDGNEEGDEDGDHATYMLGSPVSFPARGGSGGRNVA
jgi:hypothetical protein